ncbi:MAG: hypothetical protein ACJ749_15710, partial [Flavisolibacter sp.]
MKWLLLFLFLPCIANCQTVHLDDDRIAYKGEINTNKVSDEKLNEALHAVMEHKGNKPISFIRDTAKGEIVTSARMKLNSTQSIINSLQ